MAEILCTEDGVDACHVRDRGGLGTSDQEVLDSAFAEDRILVTSDVADFVRVLGASGRNGVTLADLFTRTDLSR